jgi:hypothetical protein
MTTHTSTSNTTSSRLFAAGVLSVLLLSITACSADEQKSSSAGNLPAALPNEINAVHSSTGAPASSPADQKSARELALSGDATQVPFVAGALPDASGVLTVIAPLGSALAITAAVTVEVADVRKAVIGLPSLVESKGGAIYNTDIQVGDPKTAMAIVTIKAPPPDLERLIASLGGIGTLITRTQQTEDVSTQITDVNARILTAQASVERIRLLLKDAKNLQDVTIIESELTNRETTLEQLLAQQRNLDGRVQLATLTVTLAPTSDKVIVDADAKPVKPQTVGGAWHDGWKRFTKIAHGVGVAFAYAVPYLALGAVAGLLGWFLRRRNQRSTARQSGPTISEAGA